MPATRSRISSEQAEVVTKKLKEEAVDESVLTSSKEEDNIKTEDKEDNEIPAELQEAQESVDKQGQSHENGKLSRGVKRKASEEEEDESLDSISEKKTKEDEITEVLLPSLESTIESTV